MCLINTNQTANKAKGNNISSSRAWTIDLIMLLLIWGHAIAINPPDLSMWSMPEGRGVVAMATNSVIDDHCHRLMFQ